MQRMFEFESRTGNVRLRDDTDITNVIKGNIKGHLHMIPMLTLIKDRQAPYYLKNVQPVSG